MSLQLRLRVSRHDWLLSFFFDIIFSWFGRGRQDAVRTHEKNTVCLKPNYSPRNARRHHRGLPAPPPNNFTNSHSFAPIPSGPGVPHPTLSPSFYPSNVPKSRHYRPHTNYTDRGIASPTAELQKMIWQIPPHLFQLNDGPFGGNKFLPLPGFAEQHPLYAAAQHSQGVAVNHGALGGDEFFPRPGSAEPGLRHPTIPQLFQEVAGTHDTFIGDASLPRPGYAEQHPPYVAPQLSHDVAVKHGVLDINEFSAHPGSAEQHLPYAAPQLSQGGVFGGNESLAHPMFVEPHAPYAAPQLSGDVTVGHSTSGSNEALPYPGFPEQHVSYATPQLSQEVVEQPFDGQSSSVATSSNYSEAINLQDLLRGLSAEQIAEMFSS